MVRVTDCARNDLNVLKGRKAKIKPNQVDTDEAAQV